MHSADSTEAFKWLQESDTEPNLEGRAKKGANKKLDFGWQWVEIKKLLECLVYHGPKHFHEVRLEVSMLPW